VSSGYPEFTSSETALLLFVLSDNCGLINVIGVTKRRDWIDIAVMRVNMASAYSPGAVFTLW
jgi:hypothetical protein